MLNQSKKMLEELDERKLRIAYQFLRSLSGTPQRPKKQSDINEKD